jgi:hypothetical protein
MSKSRCRTTLVLGFLGVTLIAAAQAITNFLRGRSAQGSVYQLSHDDLTGKPVPSVLGIPACTPAVIALGSPG